jgi:hypothetical protein
MILTEAFWKEIKMQNVFDIHSQINDLVNSYLKTYLSAFSDAVISGYRKERFEDNVAPAVAFNNALDKALFLLIEKAQESSSSWAGKASGIRNFLEDLQRDACINIVKDIIKTRKHHVEYLSKKGWDVEIAEEVIVKFFEHNR